MKYAKNERGIALAMMLVLAAIALIIMAALIYMITSGTQISGMQKRYRTALDAGRGGADLTFQFIASRGDTSVTDSLRTMMTSISPVITTAVSCTGTNMMGTSFAGLAAKLNTPTSNWSSGCGGDLVTITPGTAASYDLQYDLGVSPDPVYRIYAKVVDTIEGNSGGDEGLLGKGVVSSGTGEIQVMSRPYLYTIEIDAENQSNPSERAKLSVLYQY